MWTCIWQCLKERGSFIGLENSDREILSIYPKDVLCSIAAGDGKWKSMVPAEVVETIESKRLFLHKQC